MSDLRLNPTLNSKVIIFARRVDADEIFNFIRLSIDGFLVWDEIEPQNLQHILHCPLFSNTAVFSNRVEQVRNELMRSRACLIGDRPQLTGREWTVLRGLAEGLTRDGIARTHSISPSTVNRNIDALKAKLAADTTIGLVIQATLVGLLP